MADGTYLEAFWQQTAGPLLAPGTGVKGWLILAGALLWDWAFGEMPRAIHPVVWMGKPLRKIKHWGLGRPDHPVFQLMLGALTCLVLPLLFALTGGLVVLGARELGGAAFEVFMGAFLLKSAFAQRALGEAGLKVRGFLSRVAQGDASSLDQARWALRALCSRDASSLTPSQLEEAAVSSLAENLSDSVLAPLCFYVVAGIPGALFYRVVNTMDAVLGYRGPLEYLGKAPARLDDLANLIPARLTCLCLILATPPARWLHACRVVVRCARSTPSPNGGWPMAAMAGALGIKLEKVGVYTLDGASGGAWKRVQDQGHGQVIEQAWDLALRALLVFLAIVVVGTWFWRVFG